MKEDCETSRAAAWLAEHILPHEPWLRARLRPAIGELELDDIIQECFVRLLQCPTAHLAHNPRAYMLRAARSLIFDRRSRDPRRRLIHVDIDAIAELPTNDPPVEAIIDDRNRLARLSDAVDRLPPRKREVLMLRRLGDLSQREAANRLGVSESTIEKHLRFALQALHEFEAELVGAHSAPALS